jgi:hypothetical protein
MKEHWYRKTFISCPVCFSEDVIIERIYGKKPKEAGLRYVYINRYDYCDAF